MKYRLFGIVVILFFLAWRTLDGLVEGDWGRLEGGLTQPRCLLRREYVAAKLERTSSSVLPCVRE